MLPSALLFLTADSNVFPTSVQECDVTEDYYKEHFSNVWKDEKTCVGFSLNQGQSVFIEIYIITSDNGHLHGQLLKPRWEGFIY